MNRRQLSQSTVAAAKWVSTVLSWWQLCQKQRCFPIKRIIRENCTGWSWFHWILYWPQQNWVTYQRDLTNTKTFLSREWLHLKG